MQATFRPTGDIEIRVANNVPDQVHVTIYEGVEGYTGDVVNGSVQDIRKQISISLSRSDARSIASAIMGAARQD